MLDLCVVATACSKRASLRASEEAAAGGSEYGLDWLKVGSTALQEQQKGAGGRCWHSMPQRLCLHTASVLGPPASVECCLEVFSGLVSHMVCFGAVLLCCTAHVWCVLRCWLHGVWCMCCRGACAACAAHELWSEDVLWCAVAGIVH